MQYGPEDPYKVVGCKKPDPNRTRRTAALYLVEPKNVKCPWCRSGGSLKLMRGGTYTKDTYTDAAEWLCEQCNTLVGVKEIRNIEVRVAVGVVQVDYDENEKKFLLSIMDEAIEKRRDRIGYGTPGEEDAEQVEELLHLRERLEKSR